MSEFGKNSGAHGGVWECPDLFKLKVENTNEEKWVLLISINPGAPNGGSGTQYFIGDFDGQKFTSDQKHSLWLDWGTDNYAGVTYNNVPNGDRIFIGWMSNWLYARDTPTEKWRSAMTLPRKLTLEKIADNYRLFNFPLDGFDAIVSDEMGESLDLAVGASQRITSENFNQSEIRFTTTSKDFQLKFSNGDNDELLLSMLNDDKTFFLDRSNSGIVDFQEDFGNGIQQMPVPNLPEGEYEVRVILDWSSIEVFINKGQYVMTSQIFPKDNYIALDIKNLGVSELSMQAFSINEVKSIWK
jgi:fructan beta-fructosidase